MSQCDLCGKWGKRVYCADTLGIKGLKPHVDICTDCIDWCKDNLPSMKRI